MANLSRGKTFAVFAFLYTQPRMFSVESFTRLDISLATAKVFPLENFAVYSIWYLGILCHADLWSNYVPISLL